MNQTTNEVWYVVWAGDYGGYEHRPITNEPVDADRANAIIMRESIEYAQTFDTPIDSVDESEAVDTVTVKPHYEGGNPEVFYWKSFATKQEAQDSIDRYDPYHI
ncbi:hypothetical protein OB920_13245 [Halobacteria archaeon HArc-gm2]|nr:hypothetical protein [Halobacteria archaeon HArc-gm2]